MHFLQVGGVDQAHVPVGVLHLADLLLTLGRVFHFLGDLPHLPLVVSLLENEVA